VAVKTTPAFDGWLQSLKDQRGRAKILNRIDRLRLGNRGDIKSIGDGVTEIRIDFGPGYRVYFCRDGNDFVLLVGGNKDSQKRNIKQAKQLARGI
jgi:putative addiction module killer protein